jgi:hypothetical protein
MKATSSFKLSKQTKRTMATIVNDVQRHEYKNSMIRAELAAAVKIKSKADRSAKAE